MKKFEYKKWITKNKQGSLLEQVGTGSMCYGCISGSNSSPYTPLQQISGPVVNNYGFYGCTFTYNGNTTYGLQDPDTPFGGGTSLTYNTCVDPTTDPGTGSGTGSSGCDTTACDSQWLPPNLNWPNQSNFECTGQQTYASLGSHLAPQVNTLASSAPNLVCNGGTHHPVGCWYCSDPCAANSTFCQQNPGGMVGSNCYSLGNIPFNDWTDIKTKGNLGFGPGNSAQPQKGQWKRKMAKLQWANCLTGSCCNATAEGIETEISENTTKNFNYVKWVSKYVKNEQV